MAVATVVMAGAVVAEGAAKALRPKTGLRRVQTAAAGNAVSAIPKVATKVAGPSDRTVQPESSAVIPAAKDAVTRPAKPSHVAKVKVSFGKAAQTVAAHAATVWSVPTGLIGVTGVSASHATPSSRIWLWPIRPPWLRRAGAKQSLHARNGRPGSQAETASAIQLADAANRVKKCAATNCLVKGGANGVSAVSAVSGGVNALDAAMSAVASAAMVVLGQPLVFKLMFSMLRSQQWCRLRTRLAAL